VTYDVEKVSFLPIRIRFLYSFLTLLFLVPLLCPVPLLSSSRIATVTVAMESSRGGRVLPHSW
jgi:hypothetical protein